MNSEPKLILLRSFSNEQEAFILKGKLGSNHIKCVIKKDNAGGALPFPMSPNSTPVKIFVVKSEYEKAKNLI